jgi:predicted acyl esterase
VLAGVGRLHSGLIAGRRSLLRRARIAGIAVLLSAGLGAAPAAAGTFGIRGLTLTATDGTQLKATLFVPHGRVVPRGGYPAIIFLHNWGADRSSMAPYARAAASHGYVVLTYDQRGWGASGGSVDVSGPLTVDDAVNAVRWLRGGQGLRPPAGFLRPPVNPSEVGMSGISYGAGTTLNAAAAGAHLAAIAPVIPWSNLGTALLPGGTIKSGYVLQLLRECPRCDPLLNTLYTDATTHADDTFVARSTDARSSLGRAGTIDVPTFLVQGRRDFLFPPEQTIALYDRLTGPKRLYVGLLGHAPATNPANEGPYVTGEILAWFDHWLRHIDNGMETRAPVEYASDPDPFGVGTTTTPFNPRATRSFARPQEGSQAVTLYPSAGGVLAAAAPSGAAAPDVIEAPTNATDPAQGVAYVSAPLTAPLAIRGAPALQLALESGDGFDHVVAELWWSLGGRSALAGVGSQWVGPSLSINPAPISVYMQDVVSDVPAGATLRLVVEGSTNPVYSSWFAQGYARPNAPGSHLTILHDSVNIASLALPVAQADAAPHISIPRPKAVQTGVPVRLNVAGQAATAAWSFGDGSPVKHVLTVRHVWRRPGRYTVTVAAYSAGGAATTVTLPVIVR